MNKKLTIIDNNKPLKLYPYYNFHHLKNITKWKDTRLEYLNIPKGLIEVLQSNGFTIEKILDSESSEIAEKLGIDPYIGEIIFRETKQSISKINPNLLIN